MKATMVRSGSALRGGLLAGVFLATTGCGDPLEGTVKRPPDAEKIDLSRPFGNPAPPPVRKKDKAIAEQERFEPKNPKLAN